MQRESEHPSFSPNIQIAVGAMAALTAANEANPHFWDVHNTPALAYDRLFRVVTKNRTVLQMLEPLQQQYPRIALLNVGTDNDPFAQLLRPDDISIRVALRDERTDLEKQEDEQNNRYLIVGSIGDESVWQQVDTLLGTLVTKGELPEAKLHGVVWKLRNGWYTMPFGDDYLFTLLDMNQIKQHSSVPLLEAARNDITDEEYERYREWFADAPWQRLVPGGLLLVDLPNLLLPSYIDPLRELVKNLSPQMPIEWNIDSLMAIKTDTAPEHLHWLFNTIPNTRRGRK